MLTFVDINENFKMVFHLHFSDNRTPSFRSLFLSPFGTSLASDRQGIDRPVPTIWGLMIRWLFNGSFFWDPTFGQTSVILNHLHASSDLILRSAFALVFSPAYTGAQAEGCCPGQCGPSVQPGSLKAPVPASSMFKKKIGIRKMNCNKLFASRRYPEVVGCKLSSEKSCQQEPG